MHTPNKHRMLWAAFTALAVSLSGCDEPVCPASRCAACETLGPSSTSPAIYRFLEARCRVPNILEDIWPVAPRFEPTRLPSTLTWTEAPLGENYWRFVFYSLRPLRHFIFAYAETGDDKYLNKLLAVVRSFVRDGANATALEDAHTSAFAVLMLCNIASRLQEWDRLDDDVAAGIERVVVARVQFLLRPSNFQPENNHGVSQAAALVVASHTFSTLEGRDGQFSLGAMHRVFRGCWSQRS